MDIRDLCFLFKHTPCYALKKNNELINLKDTSRQKNDQCSIRGFQTLLAFVFILIFISPNKLSAQPPSQDPNWIYDTSVDGVQFYHSIADCNGKKAVFLKFNNKNNYKVAVSWKEVFTTQQGPQIEGYTGSKTMVLGLGETKETNCKEPVQKQLLILPGQVSPTYIADISKFDYKSITVTKEN